MRCGSAHTMQHPGIFVSRFASSNDLLNCGTGSPLDSKQDPRNPHQHAALKSWRSWTLALRQITTPTYSIEENSVLADLVQFMRYFPGCFMRLTKIYNIPGQKVRK